MAQQQQQQQRKKKVEWSANLSSSEPHPTENRSPMWDSESNHLLSYFLGNTGVSPTAQTQFTTTTSPPSAGLESPLFPLGNSGMEGTTNGIRPSSIYNSNKNKRPQQGFPSTYGNDSAMGGGGSGESRQDRLSLDENDHDDAPQPPPTPAIQYYFPSSSGKQKDTKPPQSSLPAASVPPRPNIQSEKQPHPYHFYHQPHPPHQQQQNLHRIESMKANFLGVGRPRPPHNDPSRPSEYDPSGKPPSPHGTDEVSPISPAGWIGPDHEPMLFPAPDPLAAKARQSHLDWLRQINAMAHQANNSTTHGANMNAPTSHYNMLDGAGSTDKNDSGNSISAVDPEMPTVSHPIPSGSVIPPPRYQQHPTHQQPQLAPPSQRHPTLPQTTIPPIPEVASAAATTTLVPPHSAVVFPPPGVPLHPTAAAALAAGNPLFFSHAAAYLRQQASSPVESEEKRAKRLERNRESARKSRRRKKERLSTLGEQVSKLLSKVEKERRIQMGAMDDVMMEYERTTIVRLKDEYEERGGDCNAMADEWLAVALEQFIDRMGDPIRKDVVEFQCTALGQYLLPRYQKFLLWLTLHPESYFMVGKDEHAKRESTETSRTVRAAPGKISSKQIGDELTNGRKLEDGTIIPPSLSSSSTASHMEQLDQGIEGGERAGMMAQAFDAGRMWPLICFELSISVDQEDKFLQSHKRVRQYENYQSDSLQIAAATRMASSLKEALLYQLFVSSFRKRKAFLEILTPRQAILYLSWSLSNRDRCQQVLEERKKGTSSSPSKVTSPIKSLRDENYQTLEALCRSLEEILKITKRSPSSSSLSDQAS